MLSRREFSGLIVGVPLSALVSPQSSSSSATDPVRFGLETFSFHDLPPEMGAADLLHSPLVGADEGGNVIGPIVRAGIPNLQTSMPSYPDLARSEVEDLAAYIHYLRQLGRHKELLASTATPGDVDAGGVYFAANCASCHSVSGDLKGLGARHDPAALRMRVLGPRPPAAAEASGPTASGQRQHLTLLGKYSDDDLRNLVAYLQKSTS